MVLIALILAVFLFERIRGWQLYRTTLFLPYLLPITVVGLIFSYIFQLSGVLNEFLNLIGLKFLALDWLGSTRYALPTLMFVIIWKEVGFGMVLFLARLMSVEEELFDAAKIDGANWWQLQWNITVPQLATVIEFFTVVSVITMLSWVFNYVFVMTGGGPGNSTMVTELFVYLTGFRYNQMNIASAVSVLLLLVTGFFIFLELRLRASTQLCGGLLMSAGAQIQRWIAILVRQGSVILATIISLFPVYFMAVSSFKTKSEYIQNKWGLPSSLFLDNFNTALAGEKFFIRFANSAILTVLSVGVSLVIACLAAYAFARMEFPGKDTLFNLVLSLMVVPPVVMVVPLFVSMVRWGLVNTYQGTSIIYIGLLLPFSVYMMTNFFRTIPREIIEASRIDGCSNLGVFWRIMMPLSAPAVITLVVVNALWVWNELLIALIFMQKDSMKTLMVGIAAMRSRNYVDIPATMAGLLIATIPIVIVYLFGQRYFIRGLTGGAVK